MRRSATTVRPATLPVQPGEVVLVAMVLLLLVVAVLLSAPRPAEQMFTTTVTVSPGDTIWSLVRTHPVPGMSTGEAAALVAEMNDLDDRVLRPGETIKVPIPRPSQKQLAMR